MAIDSANYTDHDAVVAHVAHMLSVRADRFVFSSEKIADIVAWASGKGNPIDVVRSALLKVGKDELSPVDRVWKFSQLDAVSARIKQIEQEETTNE